MGRWFDNPPPPERGRVWNLVARGFRTPEGVGGGRHGGRRFGCSPAKAARWGIEMPEDYGFPGATPSEVRWGSRTIHMGGGV